MAKQQSNQDSAEVVIFFARVRGGGSVVADSVRSLADAVDRAAQPRISAKMVKALPAGTKSDEKTLFDPPEPAELADGEDIVAEDTDIRAGTDARKKRGDGDPKDRNTGIALVGDIDFVPTGKTSLKSFFGEKSPGSDINQILVLCHYLQHTLGSAKFGPGHILTGFRHVGKPIPKDLKQTIRNMKKQALINFTDIEEIRLTTEGENRVAHELGKNNSTAGGD